MAMCKKIWCRSGVYFRRYDREQTNTQTDMLITILHSPIYRERRNKYATAPTKVHTHTHTHTPV